MVITLDDDTQRRAALQDPRGFVERATGASPLIIDEVQLAPPLFGALKAAVDRDRGPGRYVVTGSTRLLTADGFADALVGRLEVAEVLPLSQGELGGGDDGFVEWAFSPRTDAVEVGDLSRYDYARLVACGGFPEATTRNDARRSRWFSGYATTLVQKVVRQVSAIERISDLPRVMQHCATRRGQELNVTRLAHDLAYRHAPSTATWPYSPMYSSCSSFQRGRPTSRAR